MRDTLHSIGLVRASMLDGLLRFARTVDALDRVADQLVRDEQATGHALPVSGGSGTRKGFRKVRCPKCPRKVDPRGLKGHLAAHAKAKP